MALTLQDPRGLSLRGATQQLLEQVTAVIGELNRFRPLDEESASRLRKALLPDRIVASLNMEGVIATRRQTLAVMDAMRINESIGKGELEIRNALEADEFVQNSVDDGGQLSEGFIREINGLLLRDIRPDAGILRIGDVQLPGAPVAPPPGYEIPPLVHQLTEYFAVSESLHAVAQAAWLHGQFTQVHPFADGNGRTGRMLQDYALMRRGYLPIGIPPSQRDDYYAALEGADGGNWDDLVEMLAVLELSVISKAQAVVQEAKHRASWIQELSAAAAAKRTNTQHKKYLVWRSRMEGVIDAFAQATTELDESSEVIGATLREYGIVDFRDWQLICKRGHIDRSWLFSILFFAGGQPFYKTIAYVKRHVTHAVDFFPPPREAVAVYFTGAPTADPNARPDFNHYSDPHIRIREILMFDDHQYVYRQHGPGEEL
jgi:Fic family protein